MQAGQELLLDLLAGTNQQFTIPLYQRQYSWTDQQRQQLWDDVLRTADLPGNKKHFTGSVVYTATAGGLGAKALHRVRLIDGQQRVTTTTLLIHALAEHLEKHPDTQQKLGKPTASLREKYLFNENLNGPGRFKLSLSNADDPTLQSILTGKPSPKKAAQNLYDGLEFFRKRLAEPGLDVTRVWRGLTRLEVVQIILTEGVDDLGLIFESLNSTGKALAQADLIRNNVLMGLDEAEQTELSTGLWQPMEQLFAGTEEGTFDRFMRDFLTIRTRALPNEDEVYTAFKAHRQGRAATQSITEVVQDIRTMADLYLKVVQPEHEEDKAVQLALKDLLDLRLKVVQPFVLELLEYRTAGLLNHKSLEETLRVLESFLLRRAVVGERTSPLNRFFATLGRDLPKRGEFKKELERALVRFQDRDRDGFPTNETFLQALQEAPLYGRPACRHLLVRLERERNAKETFGGVLTIEHVMPQNVNLREPWRTMLGPDWKQIQQQWVHTLGNLTLTGFNSELGDKSFGDKKTLPPKAGDAVDSEQPKGYKYSRLLLTQEIADSEKYPIWNEKVIKERAKALAEETLDLFCYPSLTDEEIETLREEGQQRNRVPTVDGHLDSSGQTLRALYMALRSRLLAFGDDVIEEPKKQYIAYKVKGASNFCDMVPQPALNTVKCWLNLPPENLSDPGDLTENIGTKGKAGNGSIELTVGLNSDLAAIEALFRQALEYQREKVTTSSSDAASDTVDFSMVSASGQKILGELEQRTLALGASTKDRQYHRSYWRDQVFMEVRPRKDRIHVAIKLSMDDVPADWQERWKQKPGWLTRTIKTTEGLDFAWHAIELAFKAQEKATDA